MCYNSIMATRWTLVRNWVLSVLGLWCHVGLLACATLSPRSAPSAPTVTPILSTPVLPNTTASPVLTPVAPTPSPLVVTHTITLTWWTTEELAPSTTPAGRLLKNQLDAFAALNPNIRLEIVLKKPYGKGGVLDFLLTTSAVVPTQLPDLVSLDAVQVPVAAEATLLQPLDPWLSPEMKNDFFPFAFRAAHYQNRWVAVPVYLDAQHLVYNKTMVKKSPLTWDECLRQKASLLLPLASDDAFMLQYLALASTGDGFVPMPTDGTSIAHVLAFFKRARDANILPDVAINIKDTEEAWTLFATGQVAMAQVSASRYWSERDKMPNAAFASVPTRDGKVATATSGWMFAMVTSDPMRQAAATRLIQWLVHSERLVPWLRAAKRLPATRTALPLVIEQAEYAAFLRETLERSAYWAAAMPRETQVANAWRAAVVSVWRGTATPESAAASIVAATK